MRWVKTIFIDYQQLRKYLKNNRSNNCVYHIHCVDLYYQFKIKNMKTQISQLRSGTKNQILNPETDYSQLPKATSHVGHRGSNHADVESIWKRITDENPETMKVIVKGIEVELKANWSLSSKSVSYWGSISKEDLEDKFYLKASKKETPSISIHHGNIIVVSNGKNSFSHVCPSLIEIL